MPKPVVASNEVGGRGARLHVAIQPGDADASAVSYARISPEHSGEK